MSRIALLELPYTDQAGELLARMTPGDAPPIGVLPRFARNLWVVGAMHAWGRYEWGRQPTSLGGVRHA